MDNGQDIGQGGSSSQPLTLKCLQGSFEGTEGAGRGLFSDTCTALYNGTQQINIWKTRDSAGSVKDCAIHAA